MEQVLSGTFKYLTVSENRNGSTNADLYSSQDLKTLNLADNSIEDLAPKVFQMLTKLKSLDLSQNPLDDLHPDVFKDITVSVPFTIYPDGCLTFGDKNNTFPFHSLP